MKIHPQIKPSDRLTQAAMGTGTGKGEPARTPRRQRPQADRQQTLKDESVKNSLELPNDRDQATDMTNSQPDPMIEQAGKDVARGLKDTSAALVYDRTYKKL